jgi:hypothetical protein
MPRGDKGAYTDKQKRKAQHIEESYEERGMPRKDAEARAWATVNKESGGGNLSGSGRGKPDTHVSSSRGGRTHKSGSFEQRSAAARKGWVTRRKRERSAARS